MDHCPNIGRDPEVPEVQDPEIYTQTGMEESPAEELSYEPEHLGIDYFAQLGLDGFQSESLQEAEGLEPMADGGHSYEQAFDYLSDSELPLEAFGEGN